MRTISSRQNPLVRTFRELAAEPDPEGVRLLLDGVHLVRDALAAGVTLESVAVSLAHARGESEEGVLARRIESRGIEVVAADEDVFAALSPVRTPSGIAAIGRRSPVSASDVCAGANGLVLAALDVQDPGNLGSMLRAAEAAGMTGAITGGSSTNPFSWKSLRGSMGSALRLPVAVGLSAEDVLSTSEAAGLKVVATVARGGQDPDALDWRGGVCLLVGSEGAGLPEGLVARCAARVTIPMQPPVESLNVAVATGILAYAARRQRT